MRFLLSFVFLFLFTFLASASSLPLGLRPAFFNDYTSSPDSSSSFNSTSFLTQLASLSSFDLSFVDRRVLHKSHHSSGSAYTVAEISSLRNSFLRFLSLLYLEEVDSITPSYDVDQYWHEFILFTAVYRRFCEEKFGRFIDHFPEDIEMESSPMKNEEKQENAERKEMNKNGWKVTVKYMNMLYGENWEAIHASADAECSSCGACVGKKNSNAGCGSCGAGGCSAKKEKKAACGSCGAKGNTTTTTGAPTTSSCGSCSAGGCSGKKAKKAACGSCSGKTTSTDAASTSSGGAATTTSAGCGASCGTLVQEPKAESASTETSAAPGCGSCGGKKATVDTTSSPAPTPTPTAPASCGSCSAGGCSAKKSKGKSIASCGSCGGKKEDKPEKEINSCGSCGGKKEANQRVAME